MSRRIPELRREITELEELIADLPPAARSRVRQEQKLAELRAELTVLESAGAPTAPVAMAGDAVS